MKNIVLLCAAGMSTSMLVKKMEEAAAKSSFECKIHAHPLAEVKSVAADADVILLGPQIRFNLAKVKEQFPQIPIEAIDMAAYGMMDGAKVINRVKELLGE